MWPEAYFGSSYDGQAYWNGGSGTTFAIPTYWQAVEVIVSADAYTTINAVEVLT
jgi:hypothetical protein